MPDLAKSMVDMEREFPEFPMLVYDGPFSDAREGTQPPLSRSAEISRGDALLIGAGFLQVRPNLCECEGRTEGDVPVWRIRSGDYTAHVSVHGGYALRILCDRTPGRGVLTTEDALAKARAHMETRGFHSMGESYYSINDNIITVTYCYEKNRVRYYPDMVKVSVYLDNGELAGLDAESYVRAHTQPRETVRPTVSAEAARELVSPSLTLLSERLAVIPSAGGAERLCYEFLCENAAGEHYLLYVNAATGHQEKILILLEDENGTLAI
jgi:germination protein YpeB